MRKVLSIILTLAMIFSLTVVSYALPSTTVNGVVTIIVGKNDDGEVDDLVRDELSEEEKDSSDEILLPDNLKDLLGDEYSDDLKPIDRFVVDFDDTKDAPITIDFDVPGVKPGDKVVILQLIDGEWVVINNSIDGDELVSATFDKSAPVIFLVENLAGGSSVSPLTGESNIANCVLLLGFISLAGVAVVYKKKLA